MQYSLATLLGFVTAVCLIAAFPGYFAFAGLVAAYVLAGLAICATLLYFLAQAAGFFKYRA